MFAENGCSVDLPEPLSDLCDVGLSHRVLNDGED